MGKPELRLKIDEPPHEFELLPDNAARLETEA